MKRAWVAGAVLLLACASCKGGSTQSASTTTTEDVGTLIDDAVGLFGKELASLNLMLQVNQNHAGDAVPAFSAANVETNCNLVVRSFEALTLALGHTHDRAKDVATQMLSKTSTVVNACRTSPRAIDAATAAQINSDSMAFADLAGELTAAMTAPGYQ